MDVKVPEVGESIYEATIGQWHAKDGQFVKQGDLICELETDKINLEINADTDGVLRIAVAEEETIPIGTVIGQIEPGEAPAGGDAEVPAAAPEPTLPGREVAVNPSAQRLADEKGIDPQLVAGSGRDGRVLRDDIVETAALPKPIAPQPAPAKAPPPASEPKIAVVDDPRSRRVRMTAIRKKIAERLLMARQQTAMLTTFNEVDMTKVIHFRKQFNEHFEAKHGVKLGMMSFFVKAVILALKEVPEVNARIDGDDIVYQDYFNIGIAVGAQKGLLVPVLKDADAMHFSDIERTIKDMAQRANTGKIQLSELEGGTFTITNGGIYGSVQSTPILNPPQSGILGMHAIQKRAMVLEGPDGDKVWVRPMMNLALSYDHRIIDGKQAVTFLKAVKGYIENPEEMLMDM